MLQVDIFIAQDLEKLFNVFGTNMFHYHGSRMLLVSVQTCLYKVMVINTLILLFVRMHYFFSSKNCENSLN